MVIKVWMDDDSAHEAINEISEVIERYQEGPYDDFGWQEIVVILEEAGVRLHLSSGSRKRLASSYPIDVDKLANGIGFEQDEVYKREFGGG